MGISAWQIILVAALVLILFGRGRISDLMGDVAKGIRSFRKGLQDEETLTAAEDNKTIDNQASSASESSMAKDKAAQS